MLTDSASVSPLALVTLNRKAQKPLICRQGAPHLTSKPFKCRFQPCRTGCQSRRFSRDLFCQLTIDADKSRQSAGGSLARVRNLVARSLSTAAFIRSSSSPNTPRVKPAAHPSRGRSTPLSSRSTVVPGERSNRHYLTDPHRKLPGSCLGHGRRGHLCLFDGTRRKGDVREVWKETGQRRNSRLEAFRDGVLAIIIGLALKVPHVSTFEALGGIATGFLTYLLSLVHIGIYWSNHHPGGRPTLNSGCKRPGPSCLEKGPGFAFCLELPESNHRGASSAGLRWCGHRLATG